MNNDEDRMEELFDELTALDNEFEQDRDRLRQILAGGLVIPPDTPISPRSTYKSDTWDWRDPNNPRLLVYPQDALQLPWLAWQRAFDLPDAMMDDLQLYAFLRYANSEELFGTNDLHPVTLHKRIRLLLRFFHAVRARWTRAGVCIIRSLSDIRFEDLQPIIKAFPANAQKRLKTMLRHLASPLLKKSMRNGGVQWTVEQVEKDLEFATPEERNYERLPDGVFRLISNTATMDIKHFLLAMGMEVVDGTTMGMPRKDGSDNRFLQQCPEFKEAMTEYMTLRGNVARAKLAGDVAAEEEAQRRRVNFNQNICPNSCKSKYSINTSWLRNQIGRVRRASQSIIAEYTGARDSELRLFQLNGLQKNESGLWLLHGTVVKGEDDDTPIDTNDWSAIPIMRDAIQVLALTANMAGSSYLFHGDYTIRNRGSIPCSKQEVTNVLQDYLREIDPDENWRKKLGKEWAHWRVPDPKTKKMRQIHPHMFKESLAYELRLAECGIPAITVQLQHKTMLDRAKINKVTLMYGSIGQDAAMRVVHDAQEKLIREVYHPDARRAGGAAPALEKEIKHYFEGMAALGYDVDEVLKAYARLGMPLTDVGLGYCQGQRSRMVDGVKEDPPCIGGLRCNPVRCANGIIPVSKVAIWKRVAQTNAARAADPELFHFKSTLMEAASEAQAVVQYLEDGTRANDAGASAFPFGDGA